METLVLVLKLCEALSPESCLYFTPREYFYNTEYCLTAVERSLRALHDTGLNTLAYDVEVYCGASEGLTENAKENLKEIKSAIQP